MLRINDLRLYTGEFIGTALFALIAFVLSLGGLPAFVGPALTALTLGFFVLVLGPITGGHFNPAITLAQAMLKKISWKSALGYAIAQIAGAALAALILNAIVEPARLGQYFGALKQQSATVTTKVLFIILIGEILGTFIFAWGVIASGKNKTISPAFYVVLSLFMGIIFGSIFGSRGILNPAVAITLLRNSLNLAFFVGPFIGAALAALAYKTLSTPIMELEEVVKTSKEEFEL
jgi:aquaporin Z